MKTWYLVTQHAVRPVHVRVLNATRSRVDWCPLDKDKPVINSPRSSSQGVFFPDYNEAVEYIKYKARLSAEAVEQRLISARAHLRQVESAHGPVEESP